MGCDNKCYLGSIVPKDSTTSATQSQNTPRLVGEKEVSHRVGFLPNVLKTTRTMRARFGKHHVRRHVRQVNPFMTPTASSRWVVSIGFVDFTRRVFELMPTKVRHVSVEYVCG